MTKERIEHISIIMEIIAFFFVTIDLYGRERFEKLRNFLKESNFPYHLKEKILSIPEVIGLVIRGGTYSYGIPIAGFVLPGINLLLFFYLFRNSLNHFSAIWEYYLFSIVISLSVIFLYVYMPELSQYYSPKKKLHKKTRISIFLFISLNKLIILLGIILAISYLLSLPLLLIILIPFKIVTEIISFLIDYSIKFKIEGLMLIIGAILFITAKLIQYYNV